MAKIKLTRVLREGLEEAQQRQAIDSEMRDRLDSFGKAIDLFKERLKKAGYNAYIGKRGQ